MSFVEPECENLRKVPIVYRDGVNVRLYGLQNLHPFDSCKFEKIGDLLLAGHLAIAKSFVSLPKFDPQKDGDALLSILHDDEYIARSKTREGLAAICEVKALKWSTESWWNGWVNSTLDWLFIDNLRLPMVTHVRNTLDGTLIALKCGVAICISGGMHHASKSYGHGWCAFGDIQIAWNYIRKVHNKKKAIIIDLDVHQGDGHERDKKDGNLGNPTNIYTVDFYKFVMGNGLRDQIDRSVKLDNSWTDSDYLDRLRKELDGTAKDFKDADIIFYNAGTDTLEGDPLGGMGLSSDCIRERDEMVFRWASKLKVPIVMLLSGGYAKEGPKVIAESILNLWKHFGPWK
jgi:histone deacetylase 11